MRVGILFSGGKDSCLALHKFGKKKVDCLLAMIPENIDSFMFHKPELKLLRKQAEMLRLPLVIGKTKGEKESELDDLRKLIKRSKVEKIVIGGVKSSYQGERIGKICKELGIEVVAPLWEYSGEKLWHELLDFNFKVIITKISCEGIPRGFIGRTINMEMFKKLEKLAEKYKFRLDFEGGDAESAVLWMPEFKKEINIEFSVESQGEYRHFLRLKEVK